jgi:hypothetical protein
MGKKEPPAKAAQLGRRVTPPGEETTRSYPTLRDKDIGQEEKPATEEEALSYTLD